MLMNSSKAFDLFCCSNIHLKNLQPNVSRDDIIKATAYCFRNFNVTGERQLQMVIDFAFSDLNETGCPKGRSSLYYEPISPELVHSQDLAFLSVWVVILLVTLLSNMCVIVCLRAVRALRDEGDNTFIFSLAISDLLSSLVIIPIKIRYVYHSMKFTDLNECIFFITADVTLFTISITNIFAISVVRFAALTYPYKYQNWMASRRRCKWTICGIWAYGLVWGLLCNLKWDNGLHMFQTIQMRDSQCQMDENPYYVLAVYLFVFYIPVVIMALIYSRIFSITKYHASAIHKSVVTDLLHRVNSPYCYNPTSCEDNNNSILSVQQRQQQQQQQPAPQTEHSEQQQLKQKQLQQQKQQLRASSNCCVSDQRRPSRLSHMMKQSNAIFKASRMLGTVYGTFLICWFPVSVCSITTSFTKEVNTYDSNKWFYVFFIDTLPVLSSMLNPFIYVIMNKQYRRIAYKLLCSRRFNDY